MIKSHHLSAILTAAPEVLVWTEVEFLSALKAAAVESELTPVAELAYTFESQGLSAAILLAESHVALHFWPEEAKIVVDIHVCDYRQENRTKAEAMADRLAQLLSANPQGDRWNYLSIAG
jgi:S-adenosylmethionine decarboxylase